MLSEWIEERENKRSKRDFSWALLVGLIFVGLMWAVKVIEEQWQVSFAGFGIYPRDWHHLYGIFTTPFIHGDWNHLISNSTSMLVLVTLTAWMYKNLFWPVTAMIVVLGGLWTWMFGRPDFHIGASGVVYGYVAFLFFGGILSKNFKMLAISMLVVFLYGSLFWGIFPIEERISWESHLMGGIAGLSAAIVFRKGLPSRKKYSWEEEEEVDEALWADDQMEVGAGDTQDVDFNQKHEEYLIKYYYRSQQEPPRGEESSQNKNPK